MDTDQQQKDIFSSFFPEQQQQQQQYSGPIPVPASPVYNAFTPNSPQSPNSQLAMNMLLMQMQGLGDPTNSTLTPHQQQQQQQGVYQPPNQQHPQNSQQLVLEHQFKLTQLQQLQQLQNTILQHQFALISGQSPTSLPMSPLAVGAGDQQQQQQQQQSSSFGLPTPGPSTELRPLQTSLDFSPINIGYSMTEPSSSASSHHPSPSPQFPPQNPNSNNYGHHTPSDGSYSPMPSGMGGQYDMHAHNQHQHHQHQHQPQFYHQPGTNSAPEHIAFRRRSPTDLDLDISPLTSPWLGAHQHHPQQSHQQQQQQQLQTFTTSKSNKRTASSSGDESSSRPSRKKQSPAIRPTLAGTGPHSASSNSCGSSVSPTNKRTSYRASKSTTSTPLLRSARSRRGSTIGTSMIGGEVVGDTPSPVDLSMPPPAPPSNSDHPEGSNSNNMDMRMEMGGMMMMEMGGGGGGGGEMMGFEGMGVETRLTPVTPASIMNLGRLGLNTNVSTGNGNNNDPSQVSTVSVNGGAQPTRQSRSGVAGMGKLRLTTTERGGKGSRGGGRGSASALISPSLKPILPAGSTDTPMSPTSPATAGGIPPIHVRKTSHKAAEQKRRDSLKTTFDDLRGLLPPIALPELPSPADDPGNPVPARPLLPGALPPRGPPKAGGEGPNKGVSKLQLLICGNEYIRTLKGRVERRDTEIGKLRKEVARLRERVGFETEVPLDQETCDLEKDLDVCEIGRGGQAQMRMGASGSVVGDDDDDDGDD